MEEDLSEKKLSVVEHSPEGEKSEEQHFYDLFQTVLDNVKKSSGVSDEDVKLGITEIVKSFDYESPHPPADYSKTNIKCGYLFRYATHSAGLTRTRILEAIENCQELKSALEKEGELRVVSIGGGPGSDALGFCSVLSELGLNGWTSLNITIVDATEGWRECVTLLDQHLREGEFGSVSKLFEEKTVTMSFVQANLPGDPEKDSQCYDALKKAKFILECKMLVSLSFELRDKIIEALCKTIKDDALVLPIQTSHYDQFWKNDFSFLYAPQKCDLYHLENFNCRFGFHDNPTSKAQIRVLRKNSHAEKETDINN